MASVKVNPKYYIVREFHEDEQLESHIMNEALARKIMLVVIEPPRLGEKTARWIIIGNRIRYGAVLTGLTSLGVSAVLWREPPIMPAVLSAMSLFCTLLYKFAWSGAASNQYQVVKLTEAISKELEGEELHAKSPIVLRYHSNTTAKVVHRTITLVAVGVTAWRIYKWME